MDGLLVLVFVREIVSTLAKVFYLFSAFRADGRMSLAFRVSCLYSVSVSVSTSTSVLSSSPQRKPVATRRRTYPMLELLQHCVAATPHGGKVGGKQGYISSIHIPPWKNKSVILL